MKDPGSDAFEQLDSKRVRVALERAVSSYDAAARVEQEVAKRLLEHLEPVRIEPQRILDLGARTGGSVRALARQYPGAKVLGIDAAPLMLVRARRNGPKLWSRQRYACAHPEKLPLVDNAVDLVYSNLALAWCNDPDRLFNELHRALSPGGLLALSTFGPDTLIELRESWQAVDHHPHVHPFIDMHDIGDALLRAGFADVVMDAERLTVSYADLESLLDDLRRSGASNSARGRRRSLTGRQRFEAMRRGYESRRHDGRLPATYELVYAHAWVPARRAFEVPVENLRARREPRPRG